MSCTHNTYCEGRRGFFCPYPSLFNIRISSSSQLRSSLKVTTARINKSSSKAKTQWTDTQKFKRKEMLQQYLIYPSIHTQTFSVHIYFICMSSLLSAGPSLRESQKSKLDCFKTKETGFGY